MRLFNLFKKKAKGGQISNISKLRTPYSIKNIPNRKARKKIKNRKPIFKPPGLKNPSSGKGKKILALILSLGIFSFIIYALYFSDYLLINKYIIEEDGTEISDNESFNKLMNQTIQKNLLTYDDNVIKAQIQKEHPEIETITFKKIFPNIIKVNFKKYPTAANIIDIVNGIQKKYLVNSRGLLIEENTENPDLPYIRIESKQALPLNKPFLENSKSSAAKLKYMLQAIALFEEKFGIRIIYTLFKTRERELNLYTEKNFYVILDMEKGAPEVEQGLLEQYEKLKKALPKLDIYNVPLVYIDLRISGTSTEKVIFKRK
jgi:hypothetical protein